MQAEGIAVDRVETETFCGLSLRLTRTGDYRSSLESRIAIQVPIMLKPVARTEETFAGITESLGEGSALLRTPVAPPVGSLVNFQTSLEGEVVKGIGVVIRSLARRRSVEIAFVNPPGTRQSALAEYLARVA